MLEFHNLVSTSIVLRISHLISHLSLLTFTKVTQKYCCLEKELGLQNLRFRKDPNSIQQWFSCTAVNNKMKLSSVNNLDVNCYIV
jgi:hypothetical protein